MKEGRSILPRADTLDMACNNLRALVRLVPTLEDRERAAALQWEAMKNKKVKHVRRDR